MNQSNLKPGQRTEKCRKMRHDCRNGKNCFEKKYRCQLGKLDHLFPGMNGMTDIDGYCNLKGRKLFLEWKTNGINVPKNQLEALLELSKNSLVIIAQGDPIEMIPKTFKAFNNGRLIKNVKSGDVCKIFDQMILDWSNKI